jgi:hypothetical protein
MDPAQKHIREKELRKTGVPGHAAKLYLFLLILIALMPSGCGGGSTTTTAQADPQVSGNWQFTMSTTDASFVASPLQGGFLVQEKGSISGQIQFAIILPSTNGGATTICNSGTATVTGTLSGQTVNLTAVVGTLDAKGNETTQTLTLNGGTLSADNSSIQKGAYTLTPGFANVNNQFVACGVAQDAGSWSATLVPPLTGGFQGFFHSANTGSPNLAVSADYQVSGTFTQGPNIGTATATVTGTLLFQDPVTLLNDYPCLTTASVNGTISGNSVLLQIFSPNGTAVGQIGQTPGATVPAPVTFDHAQGGFVLHNLQGAASGNGGGGYFITTKSCPAISGSNGDSGNLCLALGSSKACNQPITLTPFALTFPPQLLGSPATSQTITLTNTSSAQLTGLSLAFANSNSLLFYGPPTFGADFNGRPNFTEQDTCGASGSINLDAGASCTITISFSPQESCPWLPQPQSGSPPPPPIDGLPPAQCPITLRAALTITVPSGGADADNQFSIPVTGSGLSRIVPSVPEIDFGAQSIGEASPAQTLTFINQSPAAVTILPAAPCAFAQSFVVPPAPRPPVSNGQALVAGIQLAETAGIGLNNSSPIMSQSSISPPLVNAPTVAYFCELDPPLSKRGSGQSNFPISNDECSGKTLAPFGHPGDSCSLRITFVPQPVTWSAAVASGIGLDDFLQLNTMWCGDANNPPENNCEIDSGRFPVEIKTNPPSSLRMLPSAGMDFGNVIKGTGSNPLTITLFNDPVDPMSGDVTFTSKLVTGADYLETDNCPPTLASNQSCTITVTFTPKIVGLDPGKITLTYNLSTSTSTAIGLVQTINLRGTGQ